MQPVLEEKIYVSLRFLHVIRGNSTVPMRRPSTPAPITATGLLRKSSAGFQELIVSVLEVSFG